MDGAGAFAREQRRDLDPAVRADVLRVPDRVVRDVPDRDPCA